MASVCWYKLGQQEEIKRSYITFTSQKMEMNSHLSVQSQYHSIPWALVAKSTILFVLTDSRTIFSLFPFSLFGSPTKLKPNLWQMEKKGRIKSDRLAIHLAGYIDPNDSSDAIIAIFVKKHRSFRRIRNSITFFPLPAIHRIRHYASPHVTKSDER